MSVKSVRGHGLNSHSLITDRGVDLVARKAVSYHCGRCLATTTVVFADDADDPLQWTCTTCGGVAYLSGSPTQMVDDTQRPAGKSPFEMLLERRSREELEAILSERLAYLRSRRGLDVETT